MPVKTGASNRHTKFEWEDKAGAYAIQGHFARHVRKIDGDFYNVVGLPISKLYRMLKEIDK